jgi:hypothetical protein
LAVVQRGREILQPGGFDRHIVIDESENIATSLANPGVASPAQTLPWFKHVAEMPTISLAEFVDDFMRPIVRVIVHHQDFPLYGVGKS